MDQYEHMAQELKDANSEREEVSTQITVKYTRKNAVFILTHICLSDLSVLIDWMSPFPILGVSGVLFRFYFIFNRNSCQ